VWTSGNNKESMKLNMGGAQGKEVSRQTPLGCILAQWRDIAGEPGDTLSKKTLIIVISGGCYISWKAVKNGL